MSTTATTAVSGEKPVRRFPPPCWTQDEALALIQSYRDRWYALRRGYLRTADWDAVAEDVGRRCPGAIPPKTSAQCRHKMEKLRQRYRAEKQRALSFRHTHFVSNWFYFSAMDSMEKNGAGSNPVDDINTRNDFNNNSTGLQVVNVDPVYAGLNPGRGIRFKPVVNDGNNNNNNLVTIASRVSHNYVAQEDEFEDNGYFVGGKNLGNYATGNYQNVDYSGIRVRPRKCSKIGSNSNSNSNASYNRGYWKENNVVVDDDDDGEDEGWVKMGKDGSSVSMDYNEKRGERVKYAGSNHYFDGGSEFSRGVKRGGDDSIGQIVSSIKVLADGFVKMEKMKMDMVHEIEKTRMEAEMKRNRMMLESQKQIVEAFVKGLSENKKQQQQQQR